MSRKSVLVLLFVIIFVSLQYPRFQQNRVEASNGYPVHNLNTGLNYTSIQEAIDANETLDGHTILVDGGTYFENLAINKTLSLVGESRETAIVDGKAKSNVVNITADRVVLTGFTLNNSGPSYSGVYLNGTYFTNITNNIVEGSARGITLDRSSQNTISLNQIVDNKYGGIVAIWSEDNTIEQNDFARDDAEAISVVEQSYRNYILNNTILDCRGAVWIFYSDGNVFSNNTIRNCTVSYMYVIAEANSKGNWFEGNIIDSYIRPSHGIDLVNCNQSTIVGNTIRNCQFGIYLAECMDNRIYHNNLINCSAYVFPFHGPSLNNVWDNGLEGNYWSSYDGKDEDHNGIGDKPVVIDENNIDHHPLMTEYQLSSSSNGTFPLSLILLGILSIIVLLLVLVIVGVIVTRKRKRSSTPKSPSAVSVTEKEGKINVHFLFLNSFTPSKSQM
jgi:parallel beta-helix repeat protein